jgi:hypothetical protein
VARKIMVVNDCRKAGRIDQQVRAEKRNESEPSDDASKGISRCQNRGRVPLAGRAGREICRSTQRQPVFRRPELSLLASTTERVKLTGDVKGNDKWQKP